MGAIAVMAAGVAMLAGVQDMHPGHATGATAPCPAGVATPPAPLAGWPRAVPRIAGGAADPAPLLTAGAAVTATLLPMARVTPALVPARAAAADSYGGLFRFVAPAAGRYRIAIGGAAWIDMVQNGRAVASAAHGHGPPCTTIRKTVDFDLVAGRHVVQLTGSPAATLTIVVARLP